MSIKVDSGYSAFFSVTSVRDAEWQRIIDKLWQEYGIRSSGNKSLDKQILHELELKEVLSTPESADLSKFLTITQNELNKIKNKKKEKKIHQDGVKNHPETNKGAEILGQQIFLAIQLKKENDNFDAKRKRYNKYQT